MPVNPRRVIEVHFVEFILQSLLQQSELLEKLAQLFQRMPDNCNIPVFTTAGVLCCVSNSINHQLKRVGENQYTTFQI